MQNREKKTEILLFSLAFVTAVLLRFLKLGAIPLGDSEAALALQALDLTKGNAAMITGQPGYVALTSVLFFIFSASDFWARFWPAVFGSLLVLIPLLFKPWIGNKPAILLTLLFAIEPGLVALSRTPGGEMMAITCSLAAIGFYLCRKELLAGISAGLALLGGTTFWPGILVLGITWAIIRFGLKQTIQPDETVDAASKRTINNKTFIITAIVTTGLVGTVFITHPLVISGLGTSVAAYFQSWANGGGVSIKVMLLGLFGTQFLAIPLAIWGVVGGSQKRNMLSLFLLFWFLLAMLLILVNPARQIMDWAWCLVPLNALAVLGLEAALESFSREEIKLSYIQAVITIALTVYSSLNLVSMVNNPSSDATLLRNQILGVVLPLAMIIVVTLLIGWGWSIKAARQGLTAGIGLILVTITFGTAWKSAGLGPRPETELWRHDAYPIGEKLLVKSVEDLSLWTRGQTNSIDVTLVNLNQSSLKWAFREFDELKVADALGKSDTPSIFVSSVDFSLDLKELYRGQVVHWSAQPDFIQMGALQWAKWFTFRTAPLQNEDLLFWARNDLFKGSNTN